jgi:glycosyltransferase involved in cell wall biosynthesis
MRLAIVNITGGGLSGGYKKYLKQILPQLVSHPQISSLLVGIPKLVNLNEWEKDFPSVSWLTLTASVFSTHKLGKEIKEVINFHPDVVFIPTAMLLKIDGIPTVTMIRNMEPLVYSNKGNPVSETIRNWFRIKEARVATARADRIIAVSKFVRDFLVDKWDISSDRIGTVYHGIDLSKDVAPIRPEIISSGWDKKFLFTAGSVRPARGLDDLLNSMKYLTDVSEISGLVIAGESPPRMEFYESRLKRWIEEYNISNKICWAGNLNDEEMIWCYQNCSAFVMTSRVEACPNIALEAMSHGCICISNDNPPMPEIFEDAAIYYPAKHELALTKAIQDILSWNADKRKEAAETARQRASKFSWKMCADSTVSELAKTVACCEDNKAANIRVKHETKKQNLKIAILNITSGGMSDGYKKFLRNIIPRLSNYSLVTEIYITMPEDVNLSVLRCQDDKIRWLKYSHSWLSGSITNRKIARSIEAFAPDVILVPSARFTGIKRIPVVTMIQNMEPITYNGTNPFIEKIVNLARYREARKSVLKSNKIIAISKFVENILVNKFNIPPEKIGLVYLGTDSVNGNNYEKPRIVPDTWTGKFLFTAGSIRPARGLEDLFQVLKYINKLSDISGIVIAGEPSPRMQTHQRHLKSWSQKHGLSDKICWAGHLSYKEMGWCYQNCSAFVMTSQVEACPNTALEALSHGCICISNNTPPMPEIFSKAAVYYNPQDPESLFEAVSSVLCLDNDKRRELSEKAKNRATEFSWDKCVEKTVEELKKAVKLR